MSIENIGIILGVVLAVIVLVVVLVKRSKKDTKQYVASTKDIGEVFASSAQMHDRLGKTRSTFATTITKLRGKSTLDPSFWESVQDMLLLADVGRDTTEYISSESQKLCDYNKIASVNEAMEIIRAVMGEIFNINREPVFIEDQSNVWLFVGVNGVGKTTSIAKLAHRYRAQDKSVLVVAADTFRAAAADQLETWANRTGADIVRSHEGADPSSVVFDGMEKANAKKYELVLIDTAGRLHTKNNLMEEVKKIRRVIERTKDVLKEVYIVIDASTGQNGLAQAREFSNAVDITGVILTKLDGSSKGGIVLAIEHDLGIPVKFVGLGEAQEDLVIFDPKEYISAILDD